LKCRELEEYIKQQNGQPEEKNFRGEFESLVKESVF
jgi:hypothetical protein